MRGSSLLMFSGLGVALASASQMLMRESSGEIIYTNESRKDASGREILRAYHRLGHAGKPTHYWRRRNTPKYLRRAA